MPRFDDFVSILKRRVTAFASGLARLARAILGGDVREREASIEDLADQFAATGTLANLTGREEVVRAAREAERMTLPSPTAAPAPPSAPPSPPAAPGATAAGGIPEDVISPVVPKVPFREAVEAILRREPTLARDAESVAAAYRDRGFALARSADLRITRRVQEGLAQAVASGMTRDAAVAAVQAESSDFSRAYAETVYRNTVTRAYAEGMHAKAADPAQRRVIAAFLLENPKDFDTTPICRACAGTIAPPEHPVWNLRTPPLHHGCRSRIRVLTIVDAEEMGLVDASGRVRVVIPNPAVSAAPGFGGRS